MTTATLGVTASAFEFEQVFNDETFTDLAGAVWSSGRTGNRWRLTLTFNNLISSDRRALWATIAQLAGQRNRLKVGLNATMNYTGVGVGSGTPLLVGTETAGSTSVLVDGVGTVSGWLAAGDMITIGNELKIVTSDVSSSGGQATIGIWPELHSDYAANTPVDVSDANVDGTFFLVESAGLGAVPHRADVDGDSWRSPVITLVLEEDVYA